MYSMVKDPDGSVHFCLHRSPGELDAAGAREALALIEPVLEELRQRVGCRRTGEGEREAAPAA